MENNCKCGICNVNVHRASYVIYLRSKNYLENIRQDEVIIPECLFKEDRSPIKNKI